MAVNSPWEPQSTDNTSLFSFPAPARYLAKGIKTENLLQLFRHTNPAGRRQYCPGCQSSQQGDAALAPTQLLRRKAALMSSPDQTRHPPTRPQSKAEISQIGLRSLVALKRKP